MFRSGFGGVGKCKQNHGPPHSRSVPGRQKEGSGDVKRQPRTEKGRGKAPRSTAHRDRQTPVTLLFSQLLRLSANARFSTSEHSARLSLAECSEEKMSRALGKAKPFRTAGRRSRSLEAGKWRISVESREGAGTRAKRGPVSPPRSSNRTCGFPASGSPTDFTMRHTEASFAPQYSPLGNVRPTSVWLGSSPITWSRFLREHPEVRALPSTGVTRLPRYYDPLRRPDWSPPIRRRCRPMAGTNPGPPPITRTTFPTCRAHYPGGPSRCARRLLPGPCCLPRYSGGSASTTSLSRPAPDSLALRPAELLVHLSVDFVTRLRPSRFPGPAARQLPDLPTTIWVGPSPTGDPRLWGALNNPG